MYTFLVISFAPYKEYIICLISISNFADELPAFTCTSAVGNLGSISLGVNILRLEWSETLFEKPVPSMSVGNTFLSTALRTPSLALKSTYKL